MDRLTRLTRSILGERLQLIETAGSLYEARTMLTRSAFEVLMLDLNLNGKDGFDLLKNLASCSFHIIVVSAYPQRAIEAYDLGVIDFVSKPFDEMRLSQSFERVLAAPSQRSHFAKFLAVRSCGRIELVPLEEIEYIKADGPCSLIVKRDGTEKTHDKMLKNLCQLLPPWFERTHKSFAVNLHAMTGLESTANHKHFLTFLSGRKVPVSRAKAKDLRARVTEAGR